MGYDMYMAEPQQDADAADAAWQQVQSAISYRDTFTANADEYTNAQAEVDTLHMTWRATQTDYFGLNIWGMSEYLTHMRKLNMVHREPWKPWPTASVPDDIVSALRDAEHYDGGRNNPDWQANYGKLTITGADISAYDQYTGAVTSYLAANDDTLPGINRTKLSSNDGWHVTAKECESAVTQWHSAPASLQRKTVDALGPHWLEWIDFLTRAVKQDGFNVY